MTKVQKAIDEAVKPYQEKLDAFLKEGGSIYEFAVAYPLEMLKITEMNMLYLKIV